MDLPLRRRPVAFYANAAALRISPSRRAMLSTPHSGDTRSKYIELSNPSMRPYTQHEIRAANPTIANARPRGRRVLNTLFYSLSLRYREEWGNPRRTGR